MTITEESETVRHVVFDDGRRLTLVGSAHISQKSVEEVEWQINKVCPDCVCIELDEDRWNRMRGENARHEDFDLIAIIRQGKFFLVMVNVILSSFQKRLGADLTGGSGKEIICAGEYAVKNGIALCLADRNVSVTLKRAWAKSSLFSKSMILSTLFVSAFDRSRISEEELEHLKRQDNIDMMLEQMAKDMPSVKSVLIDERDRYLASRIYSSAGDNKFAIVGQGHAKGLLAALGDMERGEMSSDVSELDAIPAKKGGFFRQWLVPILIFSALLAVGIVKGWRMGVRFFAAWAILNAASALAGALLSLAHPITALVAMISSPVAALTPVLGVGMVAGLVQACVRRSRVSDLEALSDDVPRFRRWFGNRILHTFLIFIVTTLASALGTFVVFPVFKNFIFRLFGW